MAAATRILKARISHIDMIDRRGKFVRTDYSIKTSKGTVARLAKVSFGPVVFEGETLKPATYWQWATASHTYGNTVQTLEQALHEIENICQVTITNAAEYWNG